MGGKKLQEPCLRSKGVVEVGEESQRLSVHPVWAINSPCTHGSTGEDIHGQWTCIPSTEPRGEPGAS